MECAAKGRGQPCVPGRPTRRCGVCGAVSYCSLAHQKLHWNDHKEECARFEKQMQSFNILNDFPFSFAIDAESVGCEKKPKRCAFFISSGLHLKAMWKFECSCLPLADSLDSCSRLIIEWNLPSSLCPCVEPTMHLSTNSLHCWQDYYLWRCLPLSSPVALLLHWPLTIYHCLQLYGMASDAFEKFNIHYLGPEKELSQLAVFGELMALLPGVQLQIEFFGPSVPQFRDGETINLDRYVRCSDENCLCKSLCQSSNSRSSGTKSTMTLKLHKGFYHEKFRHMDSHPQLCIAPNAGIAAYPSWLPSIELIKEMSMPAVFTDFCEEAAFLAAECITSITGSPPSIPIQLNPFRQPMLMEDQALCIPCYSNCFLFGVGRCEIYSPWFGSLPGPLRNYKLILA